MQARQAMGPCDANGLHALPQVHFERQLVSNAHPATLRWQRDGLCRVSVSSLRGDVIAARCAHRRSNSQVRVRDQFQRHIPLANTFKNIRLPHMNRAGS